MTFGMLRGIMLILSIILLVSPNAIYSSPETPSRDSQSLAFDERGETLFQDEFNQPPLGFNSSQWNLTTFGYPSFTWQDNEILTTRYGPFDSVCFESNLMFTPGIVADFNISASQGAGYFSIGWCDNWNSRKEEWVFNSRLCTNGVFIDCWDGELYLVAYKDGKRSVAPLAEHNLRQNHNLTLVWILGLVQLYVDGELWSYVSETVPNTELPMQLCVSGQHYRTGLNAVKFYSMCISEYHRESQPDDPEITLLWPLNGSQILSSDMIDFDIKGALGPLQYSWNGNSYIDIYSPWDIPTPSKLGLQRLSVRASNGTTEWKYLEFEFTIVETTTAIDAYQMGTVAVIDGELSSDEWSQATKIPLLFRNEHRDIIEVIVLAGIHGENLYIAVESPAADSFHSRTCLFLDGDGDNRWNTTQSDIAVTVAAPSAKQGYTGLSSPHSSVPNTDVFEGLVFQSAAEEGQVVTEFLIPLERLTGNDTSWVGIGFRIMNGGEMIAYPYDAIEGMTTLLRIQDAGVDPIIAQRNTSLWMVLLITAAVIGLAVFLSRKEEFSLLEELKDERLERIKLLLFSYERISLQRIARLIDTDVNTTEEIVIDLLARGFPGFIDRGDVVRHAN